MRPLTWLRSRPRWQRRVAAVVLCLLVGAVATLALAWAPPLVKAYRRGGTVVMVTPSQSMMLRSEDGREFEATVTRGAFEVSWSMDPKDWSIGPGESRMSYPPAGEKPWWVPWPAPGQGEGVAVVAYGFPFPAMRFTVDRHNSADWSSGTPQLATNMEWRGIWPVRVGDQKFQVAYLPAHVFWAGFVADWILFAFPLWALLVGVWDLRAWLRRRSGCCALCGYDLRGGGGVCPECGGGAGAAST